MSTLRWVGKAQKTAQVDTWTVTADDAASTYKDTINSKVVSIVGGGVSAAADATAWQIALAASTEPEFLELTFATPVGAVFTATAVTPGNPITEAKSVVGGVGTATLSTTTANVSPNDVNNATNYDSGALPVSTNDLVIDAGSVSLLYNLGALSAVVLNSLTRRKVFTGVIGLPEYNASGSGYFEYRATEFAISATTMTIEQPSSDGTASLKFNVGTAQTALTVLGDSGGGGSLYAEQMWWRGTHVANVVNVVNGSLAVAPNSGQLATIATLNAENSVVRCGSGCTLTTIKSFDSMIEVNSNVTTFTQTGDSGTLYAKLAAAITALNLFSGKAVWQSSGGITTLAMGEDSTIDFSQGSGTVTITNAVTMNKGAKFWDPQGRTVQSAGFLLGAGVTLQDVTINCGPGRTYTVA